MSKSNVKKKQKIRAPGLGDGSIIEDEFGNYKIRAGQLNGEFVARAFPKHSGRSKGLMAETRGASEAQAIDALKDLLSKRGSNRAAARRWEERSDSAVPTQEEFLEALRQTNLSAPQRSILKAHAVAGDDGLVAVAIMNAGGYKSRDAGIKALAKAGALIADFIGLDVSGSKKNELDTAIDVVSYRKSSDIDVPLHLVLHKELRDAIWQTL